MSGVPSGVPSGPRRLGPAGRFAHAWIAAVKTV
jgi:hypothetical protein